MLVGAGLLVLSRGVLAEEPERRGSPVLHGPTPIQDEDPAPPPPVDPDAIRNRLQLEAASIREIVNEDKERDFNSRVRLQVYRDSVLRHIEPPGGARLVIEHRNEMAGPYILQGIAYALDGAPCFSKLDGTDALDERGKITVFNARVLPGEHQLAVQYDLVGSSMGLFGYLRELKLTLRRTYNFHVESNRETRLTGRLTTVNAPTALFEQRPHIQFATVVSDVRASDRAESARLEAMTAALAGGGSLGTFQSGDARSRASVDSDALPGAR
jgi:hypothetical protein